MLIILITGLFSCGNKIPVAEIEKDLGISLPQHKVISKQSDFLGFNETDVYILQFDEKNFETLISRIKNSVAYNATKFDGFCDLDSAKKISLCDSLVKIDCIGYWLETKEGYFFDEITSGSMCIPLLKTENLPGKHFRNEDPQAGYPLYSVEAKVNTSKRTLYYKYSHI